MCRDKHTALNSFEGYSYILLESSVFITEVTGRCESAKAVATKRPGRG
jgi:hypothetical protein